jgi:hypothetical protein
MIKQDTCLTIWSNRHQNRDPSILQGEAVSPAAAEYQPSVSVISQRQRPSNLPPPSRPSLSLSPPLHTPLPPLPPHPSNGPCDLFDHIPAPVNIFRHRKMGIATHPRTHAAPRARGPSPAPPQAESLPVTWRSLNGGDVFILLDSDDEGRRGRLSFSLLLSLSSLSPSLSSLSLSFSLSALSPALALSLFIIPCLLSFLSHSLTQSFSQSLYVATSPCVSLSVSDSPSPSLRSIPPPSLSNPTLCIRCTSPTCAEVARTHGTPLPPPFRVSPDSIPETP